MAKAPLSFDFKDDLNSLDYQKIIVEQNNAIIAILAMQSDNLIHSAFIKTVQDSYAAAMKPFVIKPNSKEGLARKIELLSDEKKAMLASLQRRQSEGEDVRKAAIAVGLSHCLNFD